MEENNIKELLRKNGKEPTKFIIEKWDNQYEFVNQEMDFRKNELVKIIINYCQLHFMPLPNVQEAFEEVEERFYRSAFLIDEFKKAD